MTNFTFDMLAHSKYVYIAVVVLAIALSLGYVYRLFTLHIPMSHITDNKKFITASYIISILTILTLTQLSVKPIQTCINIMGGYNLTISNPLNMYINFIWPYVLTIGVSEVILSLLTRRVR